MPGRKSICGPRLGRFRRGEQSLPGCPLRAAGDRPLLCRRRPGVGHAHRQSGGSQGHRPGQSGPKPEPVTSQHRNVPRAAVRRWAGATLPCFSTSHEEAAMLFANHSFSPSSNGSPKRRMRSAPWWPTGSPPVERLRRRSVDHGSAAAFTDAYPPCRTPCPNRYRRRPQRRSTCHAEPSGAAGDQQIAKIST